MAPRWIQADFTDESLLAAKAWVQKWGWGFTITMVVIWPILSVPAGVFTKGYWAMWVFLSIAWAFISTFVIIWSSKEGNNLEGPWFGLCDCAGVFGLIAYHVSCSRSQTGVIC